MATTDANGVVFLEEDDPIAPFHTTINTLQQGTSDALGGLDTRLDSVETDIIDVTPTAWTDVTYTVGYWQVPSGEATPKFRKVGDKAELAGGRLSLVSGSLSLPTSGTLVCVLSTHRPALRAEQVGAVWINGALNFALYTVASNGEVTVRPATSLTLGSAAGNAIVIPSMIWDPA